MARHDSSPCADRGQNIVAYSDCLTPWDVQSKRVHSEDGVAPTLPSGGTEGMTIQPIVIVRKE